MPTIEFYGKVMPRSSHITLPAPLKFRRRMPTVDLDMQFTLDILDSTIRVICKVNRFSERDDFTNVIWAATDVCRAVLDLSAFRTGSPAEPFLDRFVNEAGVMRSITHFTDFLPALCTAYKSTDIPKMVEFVLDRPLLAMALHDLSLAILYPPHDLRMRCGRAIDAIRAMIGGKGKMKQGWKMVQDRLNADEAYLQFISERAQGPRHGDHQDYRGKEANELLRRSWNVMNRYLEYLKRGEKHLPESEFPLLKG